AALARSRILNCLRVLDIPGFTRISGPALDSQDHTAERWEIAEPDTQLPHIIEVAAYGPTLQAATVYQLTERMRRAASDPGAIGAVLFDAVLCGAEETLADVVHTASGCVRETYSLAAAGALLSNVLALWRHDWIYQTRGRVDYLE